MISYEYIQFLNEKILQYLPLQKTRIGDKWNFRCPLCGDGTHNKKRGWYYERNASYYCFNCSTGMSGIKFLQLLSGEDYSDIKREYVRLFLKSGLNSGLSSQYSVPDGEPGVFDVKPAVKPEWKRPLSEKAKAYLEGRKALSAPFLREDLFSCECRKGEYILIPWVVNGVDAYYQLNDYQKLGPMKYVFPKDSRKLLYGLDNVDVAWPYVICFEGVYDSLFVKNAVACGTKSVTEYQLKLIRERYPNHKVCVSFDNDEPGISAMIRLIEKNAGVLFFRWFNSNTKAKDINEYVLERDDVRAFANAKVLEKLIVTPLQMKMWLIQNGYWNVKAKPAVRQTKRTGSAGLDISRMRKIFE